MKKKRRQKQPPTPDGSVWPGIAVLVGLILVIAAALMLTFTPGIAYQWFNRKGYARDHVEAVSLPSRRWITVRIVSTGEKLSVETSKFTNITSGQRIPAWYNPQARTVFGIVLFDERIVSDERYHGLPSGQRVATCVALTLAFIVSAIILFRWPAQSTH